MISYSPLQKRKSSFGADTYKRAVLINDKHLGCFMQCLNNIVG